MRLRKTPEEKEQKQLEMIKLEIQYEEYLAKKVAKVKQKLLIKYPESTTLFEGWLYGLYVAIVENQEFKSKKGKLFYIFENIPEKDNKYKLSYSIDEKNNCILKMAELKNLPKAYLSILKRHSFDIKREEANLCELICAHIFKLEEPYHIHHSDYNKLNNNIKNLTPLNKEFFDNLNDAEKNNISKAHCLIPKNFKIEFKRKAKDVIKMEYRACDLFYKNKIEVEKIERTLRNRLKKPAIQRIIKLYPYFKIYLKTTDKTEEKQ